jgi:anti-sigma regulatory factor (Ser/Thr protein kinase)
MGTPYRGISGTVDDGEWPQWVTGHPARPAVAGSAHTAGGGPSHLALFYRDEAEYQAQLQPFIQAGLAASEPVLVAVPGGLARPVRAALGAAGRQLVFADMTDLGRNPARILLAMHAFAGQHPGRPIRAVTQSWWPGRTAAETAEVMKHEALVRLAFATVPAQILCPYDTTGLSPALMAMASDAHPEVIEAGRRRPSSRYRAGGGWTPEPGLPPPPASAQFLVYRSDLRPVRALAGEFAEHAGLPAGRRADLVLAVSELAANTLRHTPGQGTMHIWATSQEILCQVQDGGWIADPLAGRIRPAPDSPGQGLWVVNHLCDLVETRSGPGGTTIRLHMLRPAR